MENEIKDIIEILELAKEELENNDENTNAILDLQDLKALKKLYDLYKEAEKERDGIYDDYQDLGKENLKLQEELEQEKEKNKELEERQKQYLDGELITAKQGKFFEKMIKGNYIRKDKLKAIQGELCMRLGSYVRDEASPEQERIAGGINIINEILEENNEI